MNDMTPIIAPKSNTLTADDLLAGDRVITITGVKITPGAEQPCQISFEGDNGKPWCPCKTTARVLVRAWGPDAKEYIGRSLKLFRDPDVTWAGMAVGGIRIRALSHIDAPFDMALTATRGKKAMARFHPLEVAATKPDKAAAGAQKLAETIRTTDDLPGVLADPAVIKQREWLHQNRPQLAQEIEDAIRSRASDDPFTDPQEGRADSDMGEAHVEGGE